MKYKVSRRQFLAKVTSVGALGALGVALGSCAPTPAPAATKPPEETPTEARPPVKEAVSIVWGTPWAGNPPWIQHIMALFAEAYPDIQVEYMPIAEYSTKMKTMAAAHTLPDVYYLDSSQGPEWAALGACIPLDDFFARDLNMDELGEDFLSLSGEFRGKHWMVCNAQGPMGLYYNMDAFDEVGLDYPTEDWTWDDLLNAAIKLTKRSGDRVERFGLTITRYPSFVYQNEGSYLDEDRRKCLLDQPPAIEALQWVCDLYYKHRVAPFPADLQLQPTTFQNGRIAISWGDGPWSIGAGGYRDAPFRWDVQFVPKGKKRVVINYGSGMAVSSESKHPEEAWKYAAFWLTYEPQMTFHGTWESMPILKKAIYDLFVGPNRKKVPEHYPIFAEAISGPKKHSVVEPYIPGYFSWLWHHDGSELGRSVMTIARTGEAQVKDLIGPFVEKVNAWIAEQSVNW